MPSSPWISFFEPRPDQECVAMATVLPLQRYRRIPSFLRSSVVIQRQLAETEGLVGYGLDAKLFSRMFWTLSVWDSQAAIDAFARSDPHAQRVEGIRPHIGATTFLTWAVRGDELPVTWADARRRVREASAR